MEERVRHFRSFNRFYTRQIGLLNQRLLQTRFSLTQARILFELGARGKSTATDLIRELEIDPGYLSRILSSFENEGFIRSVRSKNDSRQRHLSLSAKGKNAFSDLDKRSSEEAKKLLEPLSQKNQERLLQSMHTIQRILQPPENKPVTFDIRTHRPGDIGWVTCRHGVLYKEEYDWDENFEALVAEILIKFIRHYNPDRERLWIAEQNGEPVGSVMLVDAGEGVSQLRLLLVEPTARGSGLGRQLIQKCMDFSRQTGYRKMKLWTQSNLHEARHLYSKLGWKIVEQKAHHSFGHDLVAEIWEYILSSRD